MSSILDCCLRTPHLFSSNVLVYSRVYKFYDVKVI